MQSRLPLEVTKYFWGDNLDEISLNKHKKYIIQTLLDRGNIKSISWMFSMFPKDEIKSYLPTLKLKPKSRNFWNIYLS